MKELKLTHSEEQIQNNRKSDLIQDLMATGTVMDELWNYHPENPNKKNIVDEYNILKAIQKQIEEELAELK